MYNSQYKITIDRDFYWYFNMEKDLIVKDIQEQLWCPYEVENIQKIEEEYQKCLTKSCFSDDTTINIGDYILDFNKMLQIRLISQKNAT